MGVNGTQKGEEFVLGTVGEPAKIRLTADRPVLNGSRNDLAFVTVEITDTDGRLQPNAGQAMQFEVRGPGSIAGLDNGNLNDEVPYQGTVRNVSHDRALVVIRPAEAKSGSITLTAHAQGLPDAALTLILGQGYPLTLQAKE